MLTISTCERVLASFRVWASASECELVTTQRNATHSAEVVVVALRGVTRHTTCSTAQRMWRWRLTPPVFSQPPHAVENDIDWQFLELLNRTHFIQPNAVVMIVNGQLMLQMCSRWSVTRYRLLSRLLVVSLYRNAQSRRGTWSCPNFKLHNFMHLCRVCAGTCVRDGLHCNRIIGLP